MSDEKENVSYTGAGKGTQGQKIQQRYGLVRVSPGEMLWKIQANSQHPLANTVKALLRTGDLVPDSIVLEALCHRLQQSDCVEKGYLLDGFPRTGTQAERLQETDWSVRLAETTSFCILMDPFPVVPGHCMIVSKRHYGCAGEIQQHEQQELIALKTGLQKWMKTVKGAVSCYEHGRAGRTLRVSPGFYNTPEDIKLFLTATKHIIQEGRYAKTCA